jgi:hypothetical protein
MRSRKLRLGLVVLLVFVPGCHFGLGGLLAEGSQAKGPYVAETLGRELGSGAVRTLGCLDVGLVPFQRSDRELVDVHVGNRCGHREALDLRALSIRGTYDGDLEDDVLLADPRGEIAPFHIGGAERARERIRLVRAALARRLCFDLARIAPDAPAARPAPLCFDRTGDTWRAA